MIRDLTQAQFEAAMKRHGIDYDPEGHSVVVRDDMGTVFIYAQNAGPRRRDQLAYLLKKQQEALDERKKRRARKRR